MVNRSNQQFLVTGGASGIGLATARLLQTQGARVWVWDVNPAGLSAISAEFNGRVAQVDITQPEQIAQALGQIEGALQGVIHSAGVLATGLFQEIPLARQTAVIQVNLIGTLNIAHAVLPRLAQTFGSLILLSSTSAFYGPPEYAVYGATKAGVLNMAQALRLEVEKEGIHIGVVVPSFVDTPMNAAHNPGRKLYQRLGIAHTAEDVAQAIGRGLEKRPFYIWPSWQPHFIAFINHVFHPLAPFIMRWLWW